MDFFYSKFNNEEEIGRIIVPRYLDQSKSSIFSYCDCIIETESRFQFIYNLIISQGGKKHFLQRKRRFVIDAYLGSVNNYSISANVIELHCSFKSGKNLYWRGTGALKKISSSECAVQSRLLGTSNDGDADVQVNINMIFTELQNYLEFPDDFDI